jgi:hypothetical protein
VLCRRARTATIMVLSRLKDAVTLPNRARNKSPGTSGSRRSHVCRADAVKARCVLAEVRWRWRSKVFCVAACSERNICADPAFLKPCILCSRRRADGYCFAVPLMDRARPGKHAGEIQSVRLGVAVAALIDHNPDNRLEFARRQVACSPSFVQYAISSVVGRQIIQLQQSGNFFTAITARE